MPFTLAHPAAVLPLRRAGLPLTAMVAGSAVPDLPQLAHFSRARDLSHSLLGVVTIDLAMGLVAVALWYVVFRRPLVDLAPDPWRTRLSETVTLSPRTWLLCVPGVIVGAVTHVAWDAFTHEDGWVVERWSPLREKVLDVGVYDYAQHSFSAIGLAIVVWAVWRYLSELSEEPPRPAPLVGRWALIVALATAGLSGMGFAALLAPYGLEAAAYYGVVTPMLVAGLGVPCVCVWWQVKRRWRARRDGGPQARSTTQSASTGEPSRSP
jgi:hypothetical protein